MILVVRLIGCAMMLTVFSFGATAEDLTNALQAFLQQRVAVEKRDVGVVVGIVDAQGTRVVACGAVERGTDRLVNGDTVFEIGSITKTFTAVLLQEMIERGELQADTPVARCLPESVKVPTRNGRGITLLQLATHTAGLPGSSVTWIPKRAGNPRADYTIQRLYDFVSGYTLTRDPGTKFEYSTAGVALLGQALALKAGTDYESLVVDRICRPLGMGSTRLAMTPELKGRFAIGHNYCGYAVAPTYWGALDPGAGLRSTANDLLKYLSANLGLGQSRLTPLMGKTHTVQFQAHRDTDLGLDTDIGLAWEITSELDGTRITQHGGLTDGFVSEVCFDKRRRRGVVVLCNSQDFEICKLGRLLLASEWDSAKRPEARKTDNQVYDCCVGRYQHSPGPGAPASPVIGIRREGDRLFTRAIGSKSWPFDVLLPPLEVELLPESETGFFERLSGMLVTFCRNEQGRITGMTVRYEGKAASYDKVSDDPPQPSAVPQPRVAVRLEPKALDRMAGAYEFAPCPAFPAGAKMTIWREGDQLVGQASGRNTVQGTFEIYPESESSFFLKLNGAQLTFIRNARGQVVAVMHHSYGARFPDSEGKKVSDPAQ